MDMSVIRIDVTHGSHLNVRPRAERELIALSAVGAVPPEEDNLSPLSSLLRLDCVVSPTKAEQVRCDASIAKYVSHPGRTATV